MGGYNVDISSLIAAKCSVILDVARTQTEMVECLQWQEEEAARLQEDAQQDWKLLTNLMNCVDEQARLVEAVQEHQESIPRITSSIVTPSVQTTNHSKKK